MIAGGRALRRHCFLTDWRRHCVLCPVSLTADVGGCSFVRRCCCGIEFLFERVDAAGVVRKALDNQSVRGAV